MSETVDLRFKSKLPDVGTTIFTVMSRLAEQTGALNLGQGFPDFQPPAAFAESLARHVEAGRNQYAPMAGVPRLREQIAKKLTRDYGCPLDAEAQITVTDGATEGLFDAITCVVRPGDEVIVFDPCYDSYEPAVLLSGGRVVHLALDAEFRIDWQRVKDALSPRTRLVIVNFPNNPSGALLSASDLETLNELLRDTNVFVISDEVYEHIVFDGEAHQSLLRHAELRERSFVVGSFGKAFHTTGWKVGWVVAPPSLTAELRRVHQFVTFSTSTAAQHAFADVLADHPGLLAELPGFYQDKRDRFRLLIAPSRFRLLPVAGTYFQLVDYSELSDEPDLAYARRLTTEAGVTAIPVSPFYSRPPEQRIIRFCFAKNDATLDHAAARLCELKRL
ncbi:MAG TPA: methionine aminotransferase [Polyangiaceae bacterium]|nr:methionine aminotransferase [Polyangiaceae bacterium]